MPEIKLEMLDENQADEVRKLMRDKLPQARVAMGVPDLAGGPFKRDKHILIDYHDMQLIDDVLTQYFAPQNKNWRDYQTN